MSFDWRAFFDQYNVDYVTTGPNVARGDINIKCPFCGVGDPSHHMGVSTLGRGWSCWRNREHTGKDNARLVQAVLQCSMDRARTIVGASTTIPEGFLGQVVSSLADPITDSVETDRHLDLLPEFKPFADRPSARIFMSHLCSPQRGFTRSQALHMTDDYDLHYCTSGPFNGRIIFPIYYRDSLVNWTGRSVYPNAFLRYKTLPIDAEAALEGGVPQAVGSIGNYLLWYDDLITADADTLILVEGPFDALKVNVLGHRHGVRATCYFTSAPSDRQIDLLHELLPRFKHRYLLPDVGAEAIGMATLARLPALGLKLVQMPSGFKDPGELDANSLLKKVLGR